MSLVRLRGLPYKVTAEDIRAFFRSESKSTRELSIIDVSIELGPDGRPNGEALAEFGNEEDCERALSFDRQMLGNRYVEIRRAGRGLESRGSAQHAIPVALQKGRPDRQEPPYSRNEPRSEGGERDARYAGRGERLDVREDKGGRRSRSRDRRDRRDRRWDFLVMSLMAFACASYLIRAYHVYRSRSRDRPRGEIGRAHV